MIAGCSSGIEPLFALSYTKTVLDGTPFVEINPYFEESARNGGFYSEELMRKLAEGARGRVVIGSHAVAPISVAAPFWKAVHGEERILLPALPELVPVLWEMDVFPDITMVPATQQRRLRDRDIALTWLRRMTWVTPDSEKDRVLQKELDAVFDAEADEYTLRRARSQQGIVTWLTE